MSGRRYRLRPTLCCALAKLRDDKEVRRIAVRSPRPHVATFEWDRVSTRRRGGWMFARIRGATRSRLPGNRVNSQKRRPTSSAGCVQREEVGPALGLGEHRGVDRALWLWK
jgi:hypothetical protein